MILRKVSLQHWRAHTDLALEFTSGLNVIWGRNEAGKSSLVEALDWALYRDITGARLRVEEVRSIVPATNPTARPRVEIEVDFHDCCAVLSKTLHEDSGKRECALTIRREGVADQHFDRTEAQNAWKKLIAADGLGVERGALSESSLLVAHQGEGVSFLTDGSAAIRSTLGVGNDGELALTRRLEQVRIEIEKNRKKELLLDLGRRAIDAARAGSDAARARDDLQNALDEKTKLEALSGEIEALRDEIEDLDTSLREIAPREEEAQKQIGKLGELLTRQIEADRALQNAQIAAREAGQARDELKKRVAEIARLHSEQERAAQELDRASVGLIDKDAALEAARAASDQALQECQDAEHAWEHAREIVTAWRAVWDVYEAQARLREQKTALVALQELGAKLQETEAKFQIMPKAPSHDELRAWRSAFEKWQSLKNEASRGLQIEIVPLAESKATWKADDGKAQTLELSANAAQSVGASTRGSLEIPGVALVNIQTGARGVEELQAEVEAACASLQTLLSDWRVDVSALPDAIDVWTQRREVYEAARRERDEAAAALKREEERVGRLYDAQKRVDEAEAEFAAYKEATAPFEGIISFRGLKRPEVKAKLDETIIAERESGTNATRARNESATCQQKLRLAESTLAASQNAPDALRATMSHRSETIERLREDGLDDAARLAKLDELGAQFLKAEIAREEAVAARHSMGDGVSQWRMEDARRAALKLTEERGELEKRLIALRTSLNHACDQDAETRLQELEAQVELLEPEVARHEARLRGLALLDAAITAERTRLSRDLAGPLNSKLAPWLSKLRGKETHLEFDQNGTRIVSVRTKDGDATISLPFSEHSEGMKEQVAFALRLLLAGRVASHLPSKKLPVVLDDPFTQSDSSRRNGLGEVLKDALDTLQILFITCHDSPEVEGLDVKTLILGAPIEPRAEVVPTPVKVKKKEKVVLPSPPPAPAENGTLALF